MGCYIFHFKFATKFMVRLTETKFIERNDYLLTITE